MESQLGAATEAVVAYTNLDASAVNSIFAGTVSNKPAT
jgi:hypothetical protein